MTNRTSVSFNINKKNWNNNHTFPDIIYVDTCSIMDMIMQRRYGRITEDYINELSNRNGMITWSQHTIDEITQIIHVDEYFKLARVKNITAKKAWKEAESTATDLESSSIAQSVISQVDSITGILEQFGAQTTVDERELTIVTKHVYGNYGGNLQDSKHYAIANLSGVNNILTQDDDFLRYPQLNVFGASNGIIKNYYSTNNPIGYKDIRDGFNIKSEDENAS